MSTEKIAVTIDDKLLSKLDQLVDAHVFPSRSQAIQQAVQEKLSRLDRSQLVRECSKLSPEFEQAMAEEGLSRELAEWPAY